MSSMSTTQKSAKAAASSLTYKSTMSIQQQQQQHSNTSNTTLKFDDGAIQFRQRICIAILTHRKLFLRNIRNNNSNNNNSMMIGLQAHEASFLKLIDSMTNGSYIEINATGTQLLFQPGILIGGIIHHDCPVGTSIPSILRTTNNTNENDTTMNDDMMTTEYEIQQLTVRNIGWYIEGILPLAPFGKEPLHLTMTGITDNIDNNSSSSMNHNDFSCDYIRHVVIPMLSKFGIGGPMMRTTNQNQNQNTTDLLENDDIGHTPSLKIQRRGAAPLGGGMITFHCPIVRTTLQSSSPNILQDYTDMGKVKRIRGHVMTCQLISSSVAARIAYSAKGICHKLLPDVWIHTDIHTQKNHLCGPSPSVNMILMAETTTGVILSSEVSLRTGSNSTMNTTHHTHNNTQPSQRELPEDMGIRGAILLLQEIQRGGCIDTHLQSLTLLLLCLCPEEHVNRIRMGPLLPNTIVSLRLFQQAFGVTFKVQPDPDTKTVLLSGIGIGYKNMARAST